ncbi:MAG: carboxypeptidase-like regulatory domain-containing protein [Bacteroidales bacterium]|nr:carboxypeptidase-like regulatory domain-containing protein [Bacteroidales bacterium]
MKIFTNTLFFILLSFNVSFGQGSIQGTVRDKKTNESIVGANVYLLGTTIGKSTNLDGSYRIDNLKAGVYKVIASFISYESDTLAAVRVQDGKITQLDFSLLEITTQLTGVNIQGRKKTDTDISMISSIKQSNQIVVGVSSQQIAKSQDKDASEVIRRLPGVTITDGRFVVVRGLVERYNSVWLNNSPAPSTETDKRAFSFDVIPSNLINNILIYKTPAPEIPADFAGAHIQIFTKNQPEANKVSVGYSMSYNAGTTFQDFKSQESSSTEWLGFDNKKHTLPSSVPDVTTMKELLDFNNEQADSATKAYRKQRILEISRSFNDNSKLKQSMALPDQKLNVDFVRILKKGRINIGNTTSLMYKTSKDADNILRAGIENYSASGTIYSEHLSDDIFSKTVQVGGLHNWSIAFGKSIIEFRNLINQTGNSRITERYGVNHYRGDQSLYKTDIAYRSRTIYSGNISGDHSLNESNSFNWMVGYAYANNSQPDQTTITYFAPVRNVDSMTYEPYQLDYSTSVNAGSNSKLFSRVKENIYNGGLNYKSTIRLGAFLPEVKAGVFYEKKQREFFIRPFGIVWSTPYYNRDLLYMPIDSVFYDGNFGFENNGVIYREDFKDTYEYNIESNLTAAYLSLKLPITDFINLYGGVRLENYRFLLTGSDDYTTQYRKENDTLDIFPSATLTVNLNPKSLIRLAYGRTINRPEFRERVRFAFYDFEENVIVYGNDTLKSSYVDNIDLRYEWYPTAGEIVTIGGFYKSFLNPIEATWLPVSSGGWDLKYLNAIKATSLGIELDVRKNLRVWEDYNNFLRHFKNLTLVANASVIKSRVENDSTHLFLRDINRSMFGQSPFIVNVGFYYQNSEKGLSMSLLYNIIGKRIQGVGTTDTPNTYEMPRHNLDFTLIKEVNKHLQVKVGIKDILNQKILYNQTFSADNSPEQVMEIKSYKPGQSFSLGISYVF